MNTEVKDSGILQNCINIGDRSPKMTSSQMNSQENLSEFAPNCNNSFGILEKAQEKAEVAIQRKTRCNDMGRNGRNASLPKQLKNDFILEY